MDEATPLVYTDAQSERSAGMQLAKMRGVNVEVMDQRLQSLVNEAKLVESQIDHLIKRMQGLREEMASYISPNPYKQTIIEQVLAKEEPQVILPVPERAAKVEPTKKPIVVKKPKPKKKKSPVVKKNTKGEGVVSVRHGVHADKTRMVFDMNGSTVHSHEFDKEAGVLTITLPKTKWSASKSRAYSLSQISGYEAKDSGQGSIIAMAVKNTSGVKVIPLSNPNRLVVDVMK